LIFLVALMIAVVAFIVYVKEHSGESRAIRQARCGAASWRAVFILAAPRQFRRRDSSIFASSLLAFRRRLLCYLADGISSSLTL